MRMKWRARDGALPDIRARAEAQRNELAANYTASIEQVMKDL